MENKEMKQLLQEVKALHQSHKNHLFSHRGRMIIFLIAAISVAIGVFLGNFLWSFYIPIK